MATRADGCGLNPPGFEAGSACRSTSRKHGQRAPLASHLRAGGGQRDGRGCGKACDLASIRAATTLLVSYFGKVRSIVLWGYKGKSLTCKWLRLLRPIMAIMDTPPSSYLSCCQEVVGDAAQSRQL